MGIVYHPLISILLSNPSISLRWKDTFILPFLSIKINWSFFFSLFLTLNLLKNQTLTLILVLLVFVFFETIIWQLLPNKWPIINTSSIHFLSQTQYLKRKLYFWQKTICTRHIIYQMTLRYSSNLLRLHPENSKTGE